MKLNILVINGYFAAFMAVIAWHSYNLHRSNEFIAIFVLDLFIAMMSFGVAYFRSRKPKKKKQVYKEPYVDKATGLLRRSVVSDTEPVMDEISLAGQLYGADTRMLDDFSVGDHPGCVSDDLLSSLSDGKTVVVINDDAKIISVKSLNRNTPKVSDVYKLLSKLLEFRRSWEYDHHNPMTKCSDLSFKVDDGWMVGYDGCIVEYRNLDEFAFLEELKEELDRKKKTGEPFDHEMNAIIRYSESKPPSTVTLTITNLPNRTRVGVYRAGTQNEIFCEEVAFDGIDNGEIEIPVPKDELLDVRCISLEYQPVSMEGLTLNQDSTIPIQMPLDRNYASPF